DLDDLNIDTVYYVRVVDVVGSIDSLYVNRDAAGRIINDPYPTAFFSGGFDLDAVAVVQGNLSYVGRPEPMSLNVYPSPMKVGNTLYIDTQIPLSYRLIDMQGR